MIYREHIRNMMGNALQIKEVQGIPPLSLPKSKGKTLKDYKVYGNSYQRLPQEYQEVEYIESTGTQYIDSGYTIPNTAKKFDIKTITETDKSSELCIVGDYDKRFEFGYGSATNRIFFYLNESVAYVSTESKLNRKNIINASAYENGYSIYTDLDGGHTETSSNKNITDTKGAKLLLMYYNKTTGSYAYKGKVYGISFYTDNILVRNFIPCYRKSDNEIGMYDLVENKFYTNAGEGTFLKGANVKPTPDEPIEIESCGDRTKNLFDKNNFEDGAFDNTTGLPIAGSSGQKRAKYNIPCKAGDTFIQSNSNNLNLRAFWFSENDTFIGTDAFSPNTVITAPVNTAYMKFNTGAGYSSTQSYQIEKGSTATSYEPYGYKIPIDVKTKNLFNISSIEWDEASSLQPDGSIKYNVNYRTSSNYIPISTLGISVGDLITFSLQNNYTVSTGTNRRLVLFGSSNRVLSTITLYADTSGQIVSQSITVPSGAITYKISERNTDTNLQIEKGTTATPYVPYFNETTNIYLNEPLRRIGEYADYIDFKNQKVVRKIFIKNMGEINWSIPNGYTSLFYSNLVLPVLTNKLMSNVYLTNNIYGGWSIADRYNKTLTVNENTKAFNIKDESYDDVITFKNSNIGNYIIYPLATPTEETITLPPILTAKDDCIVDVNTKILPSNVIIKYIK